MAEETRGSTFVMKGGAQNIAPKEGIEFGTFLLGLASTALIHMGQSPHPEGGEPAKNMVLARQSLDLLAMLRGDGWLHLSRRVAEPGPFL